ncbi:MAG: DUF975 family protein [Clostridia bacterium]|nr:DUF975 family protein [Clostridia bacterium]
MNRAELKRLAREQLDGGIFKNNWLLAVVAVLIVTAITSAASSIPLLTVFLAGPLGVGLMAVFKNLKRFGAVKFEGLFEGFTKDFGGTLLLGLLQTIFIALWSLLFVIPGIVKAYSYSMAYYLKSEHEAWTWRQCLDESRRLTNGHKMDLFILDLSFIGWYIIGGLCFGIGTLWVEAYHNATLINYYEELTASRVEM